MQQRIAVFVLTVLIIAASMVLATRGDKKIGINQAVASTFQGTIEEVAGNQLIMVGDYLTGDRHDFKMDQKVVVIIDQTTIIKRNVASTNNLADIKEERSTYDQFIKDVKFGVDYFYIQPGQSHGKDQFTAAEIRYNIVINEI